MTELQLSIERHERMIRVLSTTKYKNLKDKLHCEERIIILQTELNALKAEQNEIEKQDINAPIQLNDLDIFEDDKSHLKVK